jgi:hypothetical protein
VHQVMQAVAADQTPADLAAQYQSAAPLSEATFGLPPGAGRTSADLREVSI